MSSLGPQFDKAAARHDWQDAPEPDDVLPEWEVRSPDNKLWTVTNGIDGFFFGNEAVADLLCDALNDEQAKHPERFKGGIFR